jgi:hypothetical protein
MTLCLFMSALRKLKSHCVELRRSTFARSWKYLSTIIGVCQGAMEIWVALATMEDAVVSIAQGEAADQPDTIDALR